MSLSHLRPIVMGLGAAALAGALVTLTTRTARAQAPSIKLTTVLQDLAAAVPQEGAGPVQPRPLSTASLPTSVRDALTSRWLRMNAAGAVQVYVLVTAVTPAALQQLQAAGATIEIPDPAHARVQADVPAGRLEAVAALPFVTFVRLPSYAVRQTGSVTSEGDAIIQANTARQMGVDGTGVRVGVISDGLKGIFAPGCTTCAGASGGPIATGDLPAATGSRNAAGTLTGSSGGIAGRSFQANSDLEGLPTPPCYFAGAGAEGTALLEVVHDVAPGASLSFANADTDLAFEQAVTYLASTNDVVMDDLGFYGLPSDGSSAVSTNTAAALNNASNPIRAYITANGNSADEHYLAEYTDSGVDGTSITGIATAGHLHLFQAAPGTTDVLDLGPQPYNVISLPVNGEVVIVLTWNDPGGRSANNYDLYLVRESTGAVVARSVDLQNGAQDPVEFVDYVNTTTDADPYFHIVVQNVGNGAQPRQLNVFSFEPECAFTGPRLLVTGRHERLNYNTAAQSVPAQSDAGGSPVSVISAGAICSASAAAAAVFVGSSAPDESCNDTTHTTPEYFSSRGPTLDGRMKPDLSAIDGVSITGAGSFENPFFGTSAAAPHVAGEAALALQGAPCLIGGAPNPLAPADARARLRSLIVDTTMPLTMGPDDTFGTGLADALAAVQATLPVFHGSAAVSVPGSTPDGALVTASDLGFADPNGCGLTRLAWSGGCGTSPGAALSCAFGTTQVSVAASNNAASFSNPVSIAVTVTNFSVGAAPASMTVAAGQSATYEVTLTPVGGAFASGVTLGCSGLPPGASCGFGSPSLTPGVGPVQTTLTISTTARPAAAQAGSGRWFWPMAIVVVLFRSRRPLSRRICRRARSIYADLRVGKVGAYGFPAAAGALVVALALIPLACGGSTPPPPATSAPAVSLSPSSLTFGSQAVGTTSAAQNVTLTNTGSAALVISSIGATGDFAQTNTCGVGLAAGGTCQIAVTFAPTAAGARSGAVTVASNAAGSPHTLTLSGTATTAAGTPAGSYQISVTGAAGALINAGTLTLVVQ